MRPTAVPALLLVALTVCAPSLHAQDAPPRAEPPDRFAMAQQRIVDIAVRALDGGDPVEAALALGDAVERVGDAPALLDAMAKVREPASQAAAARVRRLLDENKAGEAVSLLARLPRQVRSQDLDALIDEATAMVRLDEAATYEAAGRTADAMRATVLASNSAPSDPRVQAALRRLGLRTNADPAGAQPTTPGTPDNPGAPGEDRIDALAREVRALRESRELGGVSADAALRALTRLDLLETRLRVLEESVTRVARSVNEMESRQRLDGRAEFATNELDRRVRDLERLLNDVNRSVSRVQSEVRDLSRRVDRIR